MTVKENTLLPMTRQRARTKIWEANGLPFASPLYGDLIVLSVSFLLHDVAE